MRVGLIVRLALLMTSLPVASTIGANVFLNVWLPTLASYEPERLTISYDVAWMFIPGKVGLRGLHIRQQSDADQWVLDVDEASATIELGSLLHGVFEARDIDGHGASLRYRVRADAPRPTLTGAATTAAAAEALPDPSALPILDATPTTDATPDIPGFTNPPERRPEELYPPVENAIRIVLHDIKLDDVREIWMEDYHFVGDAQARGSLTIQAFKYVEVRDAVLDIAGGRIAIADDAVVNDLHGSVAFALAGMDPLATEGRSLFGFVTAKAALDAQIGDLRFLDVYLRAAPWLQFAGGEGALAIEVAIENGEFRPGSRIEALAKDIVARFLSYSIVGDGKIALAVAPVGDVAQTRLAVDFLDFAITRDGDATPHVSGRGFQVTATTRDVALDQPFTALTVVLELPESQIPDVSVYNTYVPAGIGLAVRGGDGTVRGRLEISTEQNVGHGELFLAGHDLRATFDDLTLTGDLLLHAVVPEARLDEGRYLVSGSRLELRRVGVTDRGVNAQENDRSKNWWANVDLQAGTIRTGAPEILDGTLTVRLRDSVPFVTLFAAREPLPKWVRGILAADDVSGAARIRVGDDSLYIPSLEIRGGQFEVLLQMWREPAGFWGQLYGRYGRLSLGLELRGDKSRVHLFSARKWYDAQPGRPR